MGDALTRSASGLANQHLFFDVDFVVYCEGGGAHSDPIAAALAGSDQTHDASFWRAVVSVLRPHQSFHVKSVGSRRTAEELALLKAKHGIDAMIVCTDADFDSLRPRSGPRPPAVKTWGYSWENDLADQRIALCVFRRVRGDSEVARQAAEDLIEWHNSFFTSCARFIEEDVKHVMSGPPGVYDRERPLRCVGTSIRACPSLDENYLESRICSHTLPAVSALPNIVPVKHCFGKFLLRTLYHAVVYFASRIRKLTIDFDSFVELTISCFTEILRADHDRYRYYDSEFSAISPSGASTAAVS